MIKKTLSALSWRVFLLASVALMVVANLWAISYWPRVTDPAIAGTLGAKLGPRAADRHRSIVSVAPDGALARAGARAGDTLDFDRAGTWTRQLGTDETVGLTLYANGQARHVVVQPMPVPGLDRQRETMTAVLTCLTAFLSLGLAALIVWRKGDDRAMRAFAISLLLNAPQSALAWLPAGVVQDSVALVLRPIDYAGGYLAFLYFVLNFPAESRPFRQAAVRRAFYAFAACFVVAVQLDYGSRYGYLLFPAVDSAIRSVSKSMSIIAMLLAFGALWLSWRRSCGVTRNQIGWVGVSMGASYFDYMVTNILTLIGMPVTSSATLLVFAIINFAAYGGFAYALLRQRVFDVGLAVNRALVYTIISTLLLVTFGFTEWAVDKLLHFEGRQKNVIFDAVVALGIILSFHRIQHWISHKVDYTFFHRWHEAAAQLRHFMDRAAHISDADALRSKCVRALEAFTTARGAAIYAVDADQHFRLQHATLANAPSRIDANDDVAIALRHEHKVVALDAATGTLPAELALPMTVRGALSGLILVGAKANGQQYRPDELALLHASAHNLAANLEALRVVDLEHTAAQQRHREAELQSLLAAAEREAADLRSGNLDLRNANRDLRQLVGPAA